MKLLFTFLLLFTSGSYAFFKLAGPYEVTIEDATECDDVGTGEIRHVLRVRKVNSTTRLLQGEAEYKIPIDDNVSFELTTDKWSPGGWGKNAFYLKGDSLCSTFLANMYECFEAFFKAFGAAPQCPIAAGYYKMEPGMGLIFKNLKNFPSLPYGRYRTDIRLFIGEDLVGCFRIIINIEEIASN